MHYCRFVVIQGGPDGLIRIALMGIHSLAKESNWFVISCDKRCMLGPCNEFQLVLDALCLESSDMSCVRMKFGFGKFKYYISGTIIISNLWISYSTKN